MTSFTELWNLYRPRKVGDSACNAAMYFLIGFAVGYVFWRG